MILPHFLLLALSGFSLVLAYLIGAIPTGYIFTKYFYDIDITENGSKNIGATNVSRVLGNVNYFFLILAIDFGKAYLTLITVRYLFLVSHPEGALMQTLVLSAIALLVGNGYSPFIHFKGGKGVSTALGVLFFFIPSTLFFFMVGLWLVLFALFLRVDAAVLGTVALGTLMGLLRHPLETEIIVLLFLLTIWVFFRHRDNLRDLYELFIKWYAQWRRKK